MLLLVWAALWCGECTAACSRLRSRSSAVSNDFWQTIVFNTDLMGSNLHGPTSTHACIHAWSTL